MFSQIIVIFEESVAKCCLGLNASDITSIDYNYIDTGIEMCFRCITYGHILGDRTRASPDNSIISSCFAAAVRPLLDRGCLCAVPQKYVIFISFSFIRFS